MLVGALSDTGRYTAMIGDGVNDVPALKRARMAVAMGSGSQVTKGVADVVLLEDEFSRLPQAVAEGRRIARNVHRLGRLYLTKTVYAATLILLVAVPGFAFPFLPRHLTLAALLTIGIPSFVLALAPSDGPLYRGRLLRSLAAFAVPAGRGDGARLDPLLPAGRHDLRRLARGRPHRGDHHPDNPRPQLRAAARARPGTRAHRDPELHAGDGRRSRRALRARILAAPPVREFFEMSILTAAQWFLAMFSAALGLIIASVLWRLPQIQRLEAPDIKTDEEGPAPIHVPVPEAAKGAGRAASRLIRRGRGGE